MKTQFIMQMRNVVPSKGNNSNERNDKS